MGFNLKMFFTELEDLVKNGASHLEILKFLQESYKYAKECGHVK